ncbi:MAG: amidohydrolase family protein [Chloroflexi bacterium]|nr:amidohydrolase family protein [Chloroflexota bacterium]
MLDLKVENGTLVIPGLGLVRAAVGVKDGKVVAIADESVLAGATRAVDARGKFVMPGVFEPHAHKGFFAGFEAEMRSETQSALAGGITTIGCFLGGTDSYLPTFAETVSAAERNASTDFVFHLVVGSRTQMAEIPQYAEQLGITSFKFYMCGLPGLIPHVDDAFLFEGFCKVAELGRSGIACVHAENAAMVDAATAYIQQIKPTGNLVDWADTHPPAAEEEAIIRASFLAREAGVRLYIVHLSTAAAARRLRQIRQEIKNVFVETTSAYLSVTKHWQGGLLAKMSPPLRDTQDVEELWHAVEDGVVDSIGTDDVAMPRSFKGLDKGIWGAFPGYPLWGAHLPVLLHEGYHKRGVDLLTLVEKITRRPAELFGIYPKKGTIAIGGDADLVVVDLNREQEVKAANLHSFADWSLYEGKLLRGWPVMTIKGGVVAMENNEIKVTPGAGKHLRRAVG